MRLRLICKLKICNIKFALTLLCEAARGGLMSSKLVGLNGSLFNFLTGCLNCILSYLTKTTEKKQKQKQSADKYVIYHPTKRVIK